jgi:ADP-ribosylglycohydrolase
MLRWPVPRRHMAAKAYMRRALSPGERTAFAGNRIRRQGKEPPMKQSETAPRPASACSAGPPAEQAVAANEPPGLESIRALRRPGPRRIWTTLQEDVYLDRLEGALYGRMAGCTLGAPVEFWPIAKMAALAEENGDDFPPTDYWSYLPDPEVKRYETSPRKSYSRHGMAGVPVDDDTIYTLLGLLIADEHGLDFTTEDVGQTWLKYLPFACTAEDVALQNIKQGIPASQAGSTNNPYSEWIGAAIRADPWGYMAPGWPERAAAMGYRDAYLSHRREGIYGEMFFAAAVAAAFAVDDPVEAIRIGLTEIPQDCALQRAIQWALCIAPEIRNYQQARDAVEDKFGDMSRVHTINNACLTVWGITIGGTDLTRVIGETVAMGKDNDCTAATAGSIVGAVVGKKGIPPRWYEGFGDTIYSYLIGLERFSIRDVLERFDKHARSTYSQASATMLDSAQV